jgi:hypothetical protein
MSTLMYVYSSCVLTIWIWSKGRGGNSQSVLSIMLLSPWYPFSAIDRSIVGIQTMDLSVRLSHRLCNRARFSPGRDRGTISLYSAPLSNPTEKEHWPGLMILCHITFYFYCTSTIPVFNCYIVITSPPWPIYCLISLILPHLRTLYIDFFYCIIDCMFVYSMCYSVLLYVSNFFALSWPGRSCKWELVLNKPTWLNEGEI